MVTGLHFPDLDAWRAWLAEHHGQSNSIWMRCYKKRTGRDTVAYEEPVAEEIEAPTDEAVEADAEESAE